MTDLEQFTTLFDAMHVAYGVQHADTPRQWDKDRLWPGRADTALNLGDTFLYFLNGQYLGMADCSSTWDLDANHRKSAESFDFYPRERPAADMPVEPQWETE